MRRNAAEIATGAVVILAAIGFVAYAALKTGVPAGRAQTDAYVARFDHIDGLGTGSDVKIAGVKVGRVVDTRIDPATFAAVVDLAVTRGLGLPRDTSAEITSDGLLGGKFLSLAPGGDEQTLKPGDTIAITQGSVSLEQLLGKFIFSVTAMNDGKKKEPPP